MEPNFRDFKHGQVTSQENKICKSTRGRSYRGAISTKPNRRDYSGHQ